MKAIHVGILTVHRQEFIEFMKDNPVLVCTHVTHYLDLERETFDYFLRLEGWKRLDSDVLGAVRAIEKLRSIDKAPYCEPKWDSLRFDERTKLWPNLAYSTHYNSSFDAAKLESTMQRARESMLKISEAFVKAHTSFDDLKPLTILPDETSGTP